MHERHMSAWYCKELPQQIACFWRTSLPSTILCCTIRHYRISCKTHSITKASLLSCSQTFRAKR